MTLTFIRRVIGDKRLFVTLVTVGLALDAGLYGLAIYPWTVRLEDAGLRAAAAAANLEAARQRFEVARTAVDGKNRVDAELRTFYREILPRDLAGARTLTFARLAALAEAHGLLMERRASAPDQDEDSRLARLRVSMLLSGAYRDIRRFIHALETSPEFVIIEEIVLSRGDETEAVEVLSLELSTYYWRDEDDQEL